MENLSKRLVDKSIEAFIMGLEIYNKPTIRYWSPVNKIDNLN